MNEIKVCKKYGCEIKVRQEDEDYCKMHRPKPIKKKPPKEKDPNEERTYTCKICKEKYTRLVSKHWVKWCSSDCQDKMISKVIEQQREKRAKENRKEWREKKKKLKEELGITKKQSQEPLQKSINKIARLLDKDEPCLARPTENHTRFDAGHIFSVGAHPSLRYNLWNIHKQSVKSNRDNGGEQLLMLEGIEIRYGKMRMEIVQSLPKTYPTIKLTANEKRDALKIANRIIRELEKGAKYTRDEVNAMIGIYK